MVSLGAEYVEIELDWWFDIQLHCWVKANFQWTMCLKPFISNKDWPTCLDYSSWHLFSSMYEAYGGREDKCEYISDLSSWCFHDQKRVMVWQISSFEKDNVSIAGSVLVFEC